MIRNVRFERLFVWTGGALFVISILFTIIWYAFTLERVRPGGGWRALVADVSLFSVFALHHSVLARASLKSRVSRVVPERLLRSVYVWVASLLLVLVCLFWQPVGGEVYRAPGWLSPALIVARLGGAWFIVRALRTIDPLQLAGIRSAGMSEGLQVTGPYHLVRHPFYLGWMVIVFSATLMTGDRLAFAIVSSLYLIAAIPWEERSLEQAFGDEYRRYKSQVRWRVVPYVY
jgi:protein-S-isoprenylcysteine O-methyltransferase Ste14